MVGGGCRDREGTVVGSGGHVGQTIISLLPLPFFFSFLLFSFFGSHTILPPGTHRGVGALIKGEEESVLIEMGELLSLENRERSIDLNSTELTGSYMLIFWSLY